MTQASEIYAKTIVLQTQSSLIPQERARIGPLEFL